MIKLARRIWQRVDLWHLRWGLREMDPGHHDVPYAMQRAASILHTRNGGHVVVDGEGSVIAGNRIIAGICGALWVILLWLVLHLIGARPSLLF